MDNEHFKQSDAVAVPTIVFKKCNSNFKLKADNDLGTILSHEIGIKNGFACSRKYRVKNIAIGGRYVTSVEPPNSLPSILRERETNSSIEVVSWFRYSQT